MVSFFVFFCSQTTNVNIQQAFRAGSEFDNLMVAPEFENVSVKVQLWQWWTCDIFLNITWIGTGWQILIDVVAKVDMHTYQCFGDFWNAVHNDDAGKGLHYDVSCAYAYQVGQTPQTAWAPLYGSECVSDSNTLLPIVGQSSNF